MSGLARRGSIRDSARPREHLGEGDLNAFGVLDKRRKIEAILFLFRSVDGGMQPLMEEAVGPVPESR